MSEKFKEVANDVKTKNKYVPPQIEVVELEHHGSILMASTVTNSFSAGFGDDVEDEW